VTPGGITGNQRVWDYYEENKRSVQKFKRFDIFNLEQRLPASVLKMPYNILNRINRNKLRKSASKLVDDIGQDDFYVSENASQCFDLFYILQK
jgi:hypothetical protein